MDLLNLYQKILNEKYIQLKEETASYAYKQEGNLLYLFLNGATALPIGKTILFSRQSHTEICRIAGMPTAGF